MNDKTGTDSEMMKGISALQKKIKELEQSESDLKQSEKILLEECERLRLALEVGGHGFWDWNLETNEAYFSPRYYIMLGYEPGEFPQNYQSWLNLLHPDDHRNVVPRLKTYIENAQPYEEEFRLKCKDGSWRWISGRGNIFTRDNNGFPYRVVGVHVDINDRKEAEERLKLDELRLESLLRISQYRAETIQKFLDFALDEAIELTASKIGYIYFYDEDKRLFTLNTWSKDVMKECSIENPPVVYELDKTGIWGEAVRKRQPIVVNDFQSPHPLKKGYPEGHAKLYRYLTIPVFINNRIVAVVGVANKEDDYEHSDIRQLALLMDSVWKYAEREKAEMALRASEEKYRSIIENIQDVFYRSDKEGRLLMGSPSGVELFGYNSADEMIGMSLDDFWVNKNDRHRLLEEIKAFGSIKDFEALLKKKDGTVFNASFTTHFYFDDAGNFLGTEGMIRDITKQKQAENALKESEESYRTAIEHSNDGITIMKKNTHLYVNKKFVEMFGYDNPNDIIGKTIDHIVHPDDRKTVSEINIKRQDGSPVPSQYEFIGIKKDGTHLNIEVSATKTTFLGEEVSLVNLRDTTNRKRLESQLLHSQKMEAIGTLAGGIAHDFNNILMGIQGYASLMMLELDMQHPHYGRLKHIEEHVRSATDLTKQLLGFARGGKYETRPVSINEIVRKTSSMFGRTKKELTIHGRYEKNLWAIEADRGQIEQVFLNLYVNAWHAMPAGGELYLETSNVTLDENFTAPYEAPSGNYVNISLTDTGIGMDEKIRKRIFDPFFTTKSMGHGTGLGLAMVYGIIKGHKGFIKVYSEPGHGTTFNLYLPVSDKKVFDEPPPSNQMLKGSETILIIDDEPGVLEVNKEILQSLGYTVYGFEDGHEAIAFYSEMKNKIDLVILDMVMPGLSGSETFNRVKEINPFVRVLLSSGYALDGEAKNIMDKGCNGFIQKPFNAIELSSKIREVLDNSL